MPRDFALPGPLTQAVGVGSERAEAMLYSHSIVRAWSAHSLVAVLPTPGRICLLCQVV